MQQNCFPYTARAGSRKCLLPWCNMNALLGQTLPSDTWQGALLLSDHPANECTDVCECVCVCAGFPAS